MKAARIIAILTLIGGLSGGLLAWTYGIAAPLIEKNRRRATRQAVFAVLPGAEKLEQKKVAGKTVYEGLNGNGKLVGVAFPAEPSGFQGPIKMMIGMDAGLKKLTGLLVLENIETPGLGNRIGEKPFQDQFIGLGGDKEVLLVKNQEARLEKNEVEAISGATISSRAVVAGINKELPLIRKALKSRDGR